MTRDLRHLRTVKNAMWPDDKRRYAEAAWNFSFLSGCFGNSRIRPSDIDLVVERRGWFLFAEFTRYPWKELDRGRRLMLKRLADLPQCTVLYIEGDPPSGPVRSLTRVPGPTTPADLETIRRAVQDWFTRVEQGPAAPQPRKQSAANPRHK